MKISAAALPFSAFAAKIDSVVSGVRLGAITYSFRQMPRTPGAPDAVDVMIKSCQECGIGEIELFSPDLEPVRLPREEIRKWRLSTPSRISSAARPLNRNPSAVSSDRTAAQRRSNALRPIP